MKFSVLQQLVDSGSEFGMASLLLELVPEYQAVLSSTESVDADASV